MNYLLMKEKSGYEFVTQYSHGEMDEIFTKQERAKLIAGETIVHHSMRVVDMMVAARAKI